MSAWAQFPERAPMDVGQILNRVFQLVRANLKLVVGIASVPPLVMFGLLGMIGAAVFIPVLRLQQAPSPQQLGQALIVFVPLAIVIFVLYWLVFALYLAAGSHASIQSDRGAAVAFGDAYAVAWSRAGRYLLLLLIIYAICFFPAIVVQVAMAGVMGLSIVHKAQPNPLLILF